MTTPSDEREIEVQRLDKWLWFSRVLKSRTLAAQLVANGRVRVNRARVTKPSYAVRAGDVLTIALRGRILVLKILAPGHRRGPPTEARQLFDIVGDKPSAIEHQVEDVGRPRHTGPAHRRDGG